MTDRPHSRGREPLGRALKVRPLRWNDFEQLVESYLDLYDERAAGGAHGITLFGEKPTLASEVDWFAGLYRRVLSDDVVAVVAEVRGRVVGQCTVSRVGRAPDAENGHQAELGIMVDRGYRGRGIGRALMAAALARCRGRFEVVRLGVHASNVGARHLYEQMGFRPIGRLPRAVRRLGEYVDEELMALVLDPPSTYPANR